MPAATQIQNERDLFAACKGVPTKWFHDIEVVHKGRRERISFRLYTKKRGGTLHVETHKDSAIFPGLTIPVRASKRRYGKFIHAGEQLIRASVLDPHRGPNYPLSIWNTQSALFKDKEEKKRNQRVVLAYLMELVDPQRGRPLNAPPMTSVPPGLSLAKAGSRSARKTQLLTLLGTSQSALTTQIQKLRDRRHMAGYDKDECNKLYTEMSDIRMRLGALEKQVHDDTLVQAMDPATRQEQKRGGIRFHDEPAPSPSAEGFFTPEEIAEMDRPNPVAAPVPMAIPKPPTTGFTDDLSAFDE
jgi:hypothetical protein